MVDFGYYVNSYLGNLIPEKAFAPLAARGEAALQRLQRIYHVVGGEDSKAMAVCAMAEVLYGAEKRRGGVAAQTVGSVSVRYDTGEAASKALWRELYQAAGIYLDIYRGVC